MATYVFIGMNQGRFKPADSDKEIEFCSLYLGRPFDSRPGEASEGFFPVKCKVAKDVPVDGFRFGDEVTASFNEYGRVISIKPAD